MVVADSLAPVAQGGFATPGHDLAFGVAWLGAITAALRLLRLLGYGDRPGRMFGFRLPENVARPYSSGWNRLADAKPAVIRFTVMTAGSGTCRDSDRAGYLQPVLLLPLLIEVTALRPSLRRTVAGFAEPVVVPAEPAVRAAEESAR